MSESGIVCTICGETFDVGVDDRSFYEKMGVCLPQFCPLCRFKRRAQYRNERVLYTTTCDMCGASMVSMYNPRSPYTVYCHDCWISDKWDPYSYGMEFDDSRPFFNQLGELTRKVPKEGLSSSAEMGPNINSKYTNFAGANKNCYLIFNSAYNEDCSYSRGIRSDREVLDSYYGNSLERGYECVNVNKSRNIVWGQNVADSINSWFLLNCVACVNCFGCVNLRHKSYQFFNEQLEKDEWEKRVAEVRGSNMKMEEMRKRFEKHASAFPMRENMNLKSVDCVGNYIFESKNCVKCFETSACEDMKYSYFTKDGKDGYDLLGHGYNSELVLNSVAVGNATKVIGSWWVETSHDVEYSFATKSSEYCFGCDGIKNGKYCLLNKEYSKEEYVALRKCIVKTMTESGEYGSYPPPSMAFFGYNETIAYDNCPVSKEEAMKQGFRWEDDVQVTTGKETMKLDDVPDRIDDIPDSMTDEILACSECGRNYKIIPSELQFYRSMNLPIPKRCFGCRHMDRVRRRGPFTLHERTCGKCGKDIRTSYSPEVAETVYCEACYQAEVI